MCSYCTQSDIVLCGIVRFSQGNKNKLRAFQLQELNIMANTIQYKDMNRKRVPLM